MIGKTSAGTSAKEEKTVTAGTGQKVVTPSNGKLLSKVTINPTPSQAKTATPTAAQQTIKPDSGKLLSQVLVNAVPDSEKKGLYVWKKYQYTPAETVTNPSFTYNITRYSETVTISNENFDLTKVGENWIEFFNGFGNSSKNLEVKYGKLYDGNKIITAFDPVAKTFTVSDTWNSNSSSVLSYEGTKTFSKEQRVFLDYVVSDAETAYPDNGLQNGYWYEKVQLDLTLFGCTKCALDKFTFSSRTRATTKVSHGLGEMPNLFFIIATAAVSQNYDLINALSLNYGGNPSTAYTFRINGNKGLSQASYGQTTAVTDSQVSVGYYSNETYYAAGVEYTLITMA